MHTYLHPHIYLHTHTRTSTYAPTPTATPTLRHYQGPLIAGAAEASAIGGFGGTLPAGAIYAGRLHGRPRPAKSSKHNFVHRHGLENAVGRLTFEVPCIVP